MKVSIVGAGRVGSSLAFAALMRGYVREMALIDVAGELAEGEALDLRHATSLIHPVSIYGGDDYSASEGSDIAIITAGSRRRPDETRLALVNRNVSIVRSAVESLLKYNKSCILLVISNPVDVLTYIAYKISGFPKNKVLGSGTALDTARFRSLLGEHFGVDPTQATALILGEHGDSMVPIWGTASIDGIPLTAYPGYEEKEARGIFERTKRSGAEVIAKKGGAGFSIAVAAETIIESIALDKKAVMPVSSYIDGPYGLRDVCLSLPTVVGREGVEGIVEIPLAPEEMELLKFSAEALRGAIAEAAKE
ncbi:MAG: L-lactate dehydrogenase [bacterium]